jgi:sugar O-acyltransferase (sialic acid O-acetyltransferase NeuD family)
MLEQKKFVLWGSAGHAKVLASLITLRGGKVVALFDNNPNSTSSLVGVPLFIGEDAFVHWIGLERNPHELNGLAAIGGAHGRDRRVVQELFGAYGLQVPELVHPSASVCATASLGAGTQVLAQAVVAAEARVGEACIINHRAAVDHECVLEDGVHLAPGSTLCGCVKLGTDVMIGAGAIVTPRITIGARTIVGAGAVVTRDLPAGVIAFGNPARIHRDRRDDE